MALLVVVFIGLIGIAVDVGHLFVARTELARAMDAAALAGVIELPNTTNAQNRATAYLHDNQPDASATFPVASQFQFKVKGTRSVKLYFMNIFGFGSVTAEAQATAGFGIVPADVYQTLDATGSMHSGCNAAETTTGGACPIKEARDAANSFVDTLIGPGTPNGLTLVGAGAFRGCYNPPRSNTKCISVGSMITNLTSSTSTLHTGINNIHAIGATGQPSGGSGTNICLTLKKGNDVLFGPGHHTEANTLRFLVVLSDGDNVYNAGEVNQSSPQSPDSPCRPSSPSTDDTDLSPNCRSDTMTQEGKVDTLSKNEANTLKAAGVEIYVVALSVCGGINTSVLANPCSGVGGTGSGNPDSTADHRLLKCIASSHAGTNDHYFETASASSLPSIFQQIAGQIAFRLIE